MVEELRDEAVNILEESRVTGGLGLNKECQDGDAGWDKITPVEIM